MERIVERRAAPNSTAELDLFDYWLLIKKHKNQILMLTFIITMLATLVVFEMAPVYRSTAEVLIENISNKNKVLSLNDMYDQMERGSDTSEAFNSQTEILQSRFVVDKVINKLKLLDNPATDPRQNADFLDRIVDSVDGLFEDDSKLTDEQRHAKLLRRVETKFIDKWLTIDPVLKSDVLQVSFDSTDRVLAAQVANEIIGSYIEFDLESRSQTTQKANEWLTQRMEGLKTKLDESEKALQHYREQQNIVDNSKGVELSGSGKQFDEVSANMITAQANLAVAQSAYNQVKDHKGQPLEVLESIPAVLKDLTVQQMQQNFSDATQAVSSLKDRYAPAHPKMIAAQAQLKTAREALARSVEAAINGIYKEYEQASAYAAAAARAQAQNKAEIQNLTRKESQLSALQREVDSNKALYDSFVGRAKDTEVSTDLNSTSGRLINPAVPMLKPHKPKKLLVISLAMIMGLFLSVGIVVVLDFLDSTMHSLPDVERRLRMDVLGTVQLLEQKIGHKIKPARAFLEDPNSIFSESVRSVRTAVLLSAIDVPNRVVAMTSTVPGEGKTTMAINLAFSLGQLKRVLLIDGDIRRPTVGSAIGEGIDKGPGLVDFLAGEAPLKDCIRKTGSQNVFVLPAGKRFNSPLELISSQKFGETIATLKEQFDVVLIDCPPLKPVSDALIISSYVNAVIYVVKADSTPHQLASAAIKRLQDIHAPLLGVVLNLVDHKKSDRYGHYDYQYQYKYQYGYGQENAGKKPRKFLGIKV